MAKIAAEIIFLTTSNVDNTCNISQTFFAFLWLVSISGFHSQTLTFFLKKCKDNECDTSCTYLCSCRQIRALLTAYAE